MDDALHLHLGIVEKASDTRRGDDGVQISTPRSTNKVDDALSAIPNLAKVEDHVKGPHIHNNL